MSAAIVIHIQNSLMKRFGQAGALDAGHAVQLESLGTHRSWIFDRMARRGVFVQTHDGRYYMDEQAADAFRQIRRNRMLAWIIALILAWLCVWGASRLLHGHW